MFYSCTNLKTVYTSSTFTTSNVYTSSSDYYYYVFSSDTKLV